MNFAVDLAYAIVDAWERAFFRMNYIVYYIDLEGVSR